MNAEWKQAVIRHIETYKKSDGSEGGVVMGMPVLLLTTVGRKSGQERVAPLCYVVDGDHYVVAASAAGSDKHPDWFLNLSDNSDVIVQVGAVISERRAVVQVDDERTRLWAQLTAAGAFFASYQEKTARTIPVIALVPR